MTQADAFDILFNDTMNADGAFVMLRLGMDPGAERILRMRKSLRVLWRAFSSSETIPHELAFICGAIIYFSAECRTNLHDAPAREKLLDAVEDLAQGAFDVLAGGRAGEWIVSRPELDDNLDG